MNCLKAEQMTKPRPVPRVRVELPELGEGTYVWVHGFTARERERFMARFRGKGVTDEMRQSFDAQRIVEACRDDDGNPVFGPEHVAFLMDQPNGLVDRLATACLELDDGKNVLSLAKNSDAATPDGE